MDMVLFRQRIASAFHHTSGERGSVTKQARSRGVSRQAIYRQSRWVHQQLLAPDWQTERSALQQHVRELEERLAQLEQQLADRIVLDADKQAEFASVGQAIGVTLPKARKLLAVLLVNKRVPSVAKLGRWTKAAGERASGMLAVLDEVAKPKVRQAVVDEIYTKKAVLMTVEPESMCWVGGRLSEHVNGEAWQAELSGLPNLEAVTRDAGSGLSRGVKLLNQERAERGVDPVVDNLDHFHSLREGSRGLGRTARQAKQAYEKAEKAQKELDKLGRQGQSLSGISNHVNALWRKAEKAMDVWSEREGLWQQAKDALKLVTPEGELNTRERAEKVLSDVLEQLPDKDFAKGKRQLRQAETLNYLDQVHKKLKELPASEDVKKAAVKQECLRRRPELLQGETTQAASLRGVMMACAVALFGAGETGKETAKAVRSIFRSSWRASSLVECLNSVLRMQQASHRKMSQGLLDLKRLHWNCHEFRTGRRRGKSPYEHLGIRLPSGVSWWELLKWPPEQLRQHLSAQKMAI
jgi:cell division septum initiation protein DivIVA